MDTNRSTENPAVSPEHTQDASTGAFNLLSLGVQRQLWRMRWTQLRPIQADAIRAIIQSKSDLVISAETASGKTEAAFLPIISRICDDSLGSVRAVYVGPLKALINDQFQRIEDLCQFVDVPTHRWHGDVGATAKSALVKNPSGVLLITPESLESLFVNRSEHLQNLFGGLQFVVIDELHSFLENERGIHLRSLLCRLQRVLAKSNRRFRMVGLSATLGDLSVAQKYLNQESWSSVQVIRDESGNKELKFRLHAYQPGERRPGKDKHASDQYVEINSESEPLNSGSDEQDLEVKQQIAEDLVAHCHGASNLVFANAKGDIEVYADLCKRTAIRNALPDTFLVHHGSLSREIREDAEHVMKSGHRRTVVCSSTLEMGIDIGSVRMVGQIGAPWSVASMKQRLGRSGRKDEDPRIMRVYIPCRKLGPDTELVNRLYPELIQAIATTQLLLSDWVEPPASATCDLSTLTQQIISVVAETGGTTASELYERLVTSGAFRNITPDLFRSTLQSLGRRDVIEQMDTGELILGSDGEFIRSGKDFYAAFQTPAEFSVTTGDRQIGTLPMKTIPNVGDHLLLGGRRWKIDNIDFDRSRIFVAPARGAKRPLFISTPGSIHGKIREKMRDVLRASDQFAYLNDTAKDLLDIARRSANEHAIFDQPLVPLSQSKILWFTWASTEVQTTLKAILESAGICSKDRGIAVEITASANELVSQLTRLLAGKFNSRTLASFVYPKRRRKYDEYLSEELLNASIAQDVLEVNKAVQYCQKLISSLPNHSTFQSNADRLHSEPICRNAPPQTSPSTDKPRQIKTVAKSGGEGPTFCRPVQHNNTPNAAHVALMDINSYLVFDFETTGFSPVNDRIIQVGICRVVNNTVADTASWLVKQDVHSSRQAQNVHGITQNRLRQYGIPPITSLQRLLTAISNAPLCVGHNIVRFDLPFLLAECSRYAIDAPAIEHFHDTAALFKGWKLDSRYNHINESPHQYAQRILSIRAQGLKYSIPVCIEEFGIKAENRQLHDAAVDAQLTHEIFEHLRRA